MARRKSFFRNPSKKTAPFLHSGGANSSQISFDELPPAFSFEKMPDNSGHSFNCCENEDRLHLARRMFMLSRMSWRDIRLAPRKGLGAEKIYRNSIKKPIPNSITEDVDFFYSLHYIGKKRFLGYKVGQIFQIVWVDHNFSVYDHGS